MLETESPESLNISNVTRFCTTTKYILFETAPMWVPDKSLPSDWKGDSVWHGETEIADYSCVNTKSTADNHLCSNIVDEISHGKANLETRWYTQDVPQDPVLPLDKITINFKVF